MEKYVITEEMTENEIDMIINESIECLRNYIKHSDNVTPDDVINTREFLIAYDDVPWDYAPCEEEMRYKPLADQLRMREINNISEMMEGMMKHISIPPSFEIGAYIKSNLSSEEMFNLRKNIETIKKWEKKMPNLFMCAIIEGLGKLYDF